MNSDPLFVLTSRCSARTHVCFLRTEIGVGTVVGARTVVRVFPLRRGTRTSQTDVAELVRLAMRAAAERSLSCEMIVFPAGAVLLPTMQLGSVRWTDTERLAVRAKLVEWGTVFGRSLPENHPPVCLGVDAHVAFSDGLQAPYAVQSGVVLVDREPASVTLESKPANAEERWCLPIAWDHEHARPTGTALIEHGPLTELHGERTLVLVCHDAVAFASRSVRSTRAGSWSDTIRRQYEALIETHRPAQVLHLIRELPGRADAQRILVPTFQSAHRALRDRYGMRVVAVAAPHPELALPAFQHMHAHLACDRPHLDLLVTCARPTAHRRIRTRFLGDAYPEFE